MKKLRYYLLLILACSRTAIAKSVDFELTIQGESFDVSRKNQLSDLGEGDNDTNISFPDKENNQYHFDLQYSALPKNRSYPSSLDITISDGAKNKLGYLFWATNNVESLRRIGVFGMIINIDGEQVDFRLTFDADIEGTLDIESIEGERFFQDTLLPKYGFQMIRPVLVPMVSDGLRSQTYALDSHPYAVNYSILEVGKGNVEFQYNFLRTDGAHEQLLKRIYYRADSITTLRDGMFAGKYFDEDAGSVKLVFYPAQGQTQPVMQ